jgi:ceramide glucosyltransferase
MLWLAIISGILASLSFGLSVWQFIVAMRFPLHRRTGDRAFAPSITILKPLKGCDAETAACLRSWLAQDYAGPVRILFGVASPEDPVCVVVKGLLAEFPERDARLVLCAESPGANAKVSTLVQLDTVATGELVLVSDADTRVPPDFLMNVVDGFREAQTGLVHCFYRLANPQTAAMRWEAVAINADFWSQVLQSRSLKPVDFALGAVMVVRRTVLDDIGGFGTLKDYLADDYQLGRKVAASGKKIELCPLVVECWEAPMDWAAVIGHQLRWARTIRVCQPVPYFLSILSNATLWPLLWLFIHPADWAFAAAGAFLFWRMLSAQWLQHRLTTAPPNPADSLLVLTKDLLGAAIWAAAFIGREVQWRGRRYRVLRGGKLSPVESGA